MAMVQMQISYDPVADRSFVYLAPIAAGDVMHDIIAEDDVMNGDVVIAVNAHGQVLGFEITNAARTLPPGLLTQLLSAAGSPDEDVAAP